METLENQEDGSDALFPSTCSQGEEVEYVEGYEAFLECIRLVRGPNPYETPGTATFTINYGLNTKMKPPEPKNQNPSRVYDNPHIPDSFWWNSEYWDGEDEE